MTADTMMQSNQYDWDRRHEIWFIAGINANILAAGLWSPSGPLKRPFEEMNELFINRGLVDAAHSFPIRWDEFEKTFGYELHYLERDEILEPLLAFSRDELSLRSTYSIKLEIQSRLGVKLRYIDDPRLPTFYYDIAMTEEDFFFDEFLPLGIDWYVCDPVKFVAWVLKDRRWSVMATVDSI